MEYRSTYGTSKELGATPQPHLDVHSAPPKFHSCKRRIVQDPKSTSFTIIVVL